jgi:hypothetical protein
MKTSRWLGILMAAALVLTGGALLALAAPSGEPGEPSDQVVVKVDDTMQTIALEELADGESREIAAGERTVTVTRRGDHLEVVLDGRELGLGGDTLEKMVWVGKEGAAEPSSCRVVVVKDAAASEDEGPCTLVVRTRRAGEEETEVDVEAFAGGECSELEAAEGKHTMIFIPDEQGGEPVVVMEAGRKAGMVRYRCEATGSELLVPKEAAVADSYVCPATACVMTRVAEPELRVIKVIKRVETGDDEPTE